MGWTFDWVAEGGPALIPGPAQTGAESTVINLVQWLKLALEITGALVIGVGVIIAGYYFFRSLTSARIRNYNRIRLVLSRYLALALEFQLGADIISTAVAPTWDQIGKLAAIAFIRTALNYFLSREMKEEQEATELEERSEAQLDAQLDAPSDGPRPGGKTTGPTPRSA
ncbi:MAG: DUF1622 domain-containing protein [Cytophagales bacterium]|nr:DUF1622 domain-containing protein [Cytophagales bacterium]